MTVADEETGIVVPERIRQPAKRFVAEFARVAGDRDAVFGVIDKVLPDVSPEDRLAVSIAALCLVFTECVSEPSEHPVQVPIDLMSAVTDEGEPE